MNKKTLLLLLLCSLFLIGCNKQTNVSQNKLKANNGKVTLENKTTKFNEEEVLAYLKDDYEGESALGSIEIIDLQFDNETLTISLDTKSPEAVLAEALVSDAISGITDKFLSKYPNIKIYEFKIKDIGFISLDSKTAIDGEMGRYFPLTDSGVADTLREMYGLD